jgi:D-alanyl-D-alanine dipeptidase
MIGKSIRMRRAPRWQPWAIAALGTVLASGQGVAQGVLPAGFVYLRDVDPTIAQDIRYAGSDNFVGRPLAGYDAAECILRRDAAAALKRVQADLAVTGLALKVYDCYRPERAVRTMLQWANDGRADGLNKRFFPKLQKSTLFGLGYIATRSAHSTGAAIDLTLIETSRAPAAAFDPAATYAPCTAPAAQRSPDNSADMGTGYDCFDVNSHTASAGVNAEQRRWRGVLLAAMVKRGFRNYHREWWHFTYAGAAPASRHDFPIRSHVAKVPPD